MNKSEGSCVLMCDSGTAEKVDAGTVGLFFTFDGSSATVPFASIKSEWNF